MDRSVLNIDISAFPIAVERVIDRGLRGRPVLVARPDRRARRCWWSRTRRRGRECGSECRSPWRCGAVRVRRSCIRTRRSTGGPRGRSWRFWVDTRLWSSRPRSGRPSSISRARRGCSRGAGCGGTHPQGDRRSAAPQADGRPGDQQAGEPRGGAGDPAGRSVRRLPGFGGAVPGAAAGRIAAGGARRNGERLVDLNVVRVADVLRFSPAQLLIAFGTQGGGCAARRSGSTPHRSARRRRRRRSSRRRRSPRTRTRRRLS